MKNGTFERLIYRAKSGKTIGFQETLFYTLCQGFLILECVKFFPFALNLH